MMDQGDFSYPIDIPVKRRNQIHEAGSREVGFEVLCVEMEMHLAEMTDAEFAKFYQLVENWRIRRLSMKIAVPWKDRLEQAK